MKCIFCGKQEKLTKEHVFPNWLSNLYENNDLVINEFVGDTNIKWLSKIFQHKARVVCRDCNNGWMSDLEKSVIPIIKKMILLKKMTIDENSQKILSFWAQKTALMINQSMPSGIKITQDVFDDIYKNKSHSNKILVNLGWRMKFNGKKEEPIGSFYIMQIPSVDINKKIFNNVKHQIENGGFIWKSILSIGPIVFELIGHNMNVKLEITCNSKVFNCIRPYKNDLNWPLDWPIEAEGGLQKIRSRC